MRRIARGLLVALLGVLAAVSAASASAAHRRRPVPAPTWTSRQLLGDAPQTISCASSSFCVAVGGQDAYEYDGSEWSSFDIDSDQSLAAVSCPTSRFCAAVDSSGRVVAYNGSGWSRPHPTEYFSSTAAATRAAFRR